MKKYKIIHVLLITALLGFFYSCDLFEEEEEEEEEEETSLLKDNLTQDEIIAIETLENLPRNEQLKLLFTEKMYNTITADAKNNPICVEPNAGQLGLPAKPNSEWYYTYENFIKGMTRIIKFAAEGSIQMRKREIAAFFAHVAQETGSGDLYGGGCYIQEKNAPSNYYDKNKKGGDASKSYKGRGPIKLSWNYNYKSFSEDMNRPDILQDPDVLTREPEIGIASSFWFWNSITPQWDGSVNPPFKPAPHDVIIGNWTPTRNDIAAGRTKDSYFGVTTNILNGGVECNVTPTKDPQNPSNSRARYFREYARILQVDLEKVTDAELTCFDQSNFANAPS